MNKISLSDPRWFEYCIEDLYKGFSLKDTIKTHIELKISTLTFTNGEKEFVGRGNSIEEAFIDVFNKIDTFVI